MSPWINYHHLFYFKTIAEEGTVSKAAAKLRVGQPTLSAQLKQFEDNLGVLLFERKHKRLILTEQGRLALDYAKNIFRLGSEMYEVLQDRLRTPKPSLHIGAMDSVPKQVVLQMVHDALKISNCQITLSEGKFDELVRELSAHRMDLILTNFLPAGPESRGIFPKSLGRVPVSFFGSKEFQRLRKGFPRSISGVPMTVPTYDSKLRQDLDHWAKLHEIELNIIVESQDVSVKKLVAGSGLGVLPTTSLAVQEMILSGQLVEIGVLQGVFEELYLVTAQRKIENPMSLELKNSFKVDLRPKALGWPSRKPLRE